MARSAGLDATDVPGAAAGTDLEHRWDPQGTVEALADALAALHALPLTPAVAASAIDPEVLAADVQASIAAESAAGAGPAVDPAYAHIGLDRLAAILCDGAAGLERDTPVATHGRPGPSTLRLRGGRPVGFAGWDGAAVADRHRDLAAAAAEVAATLGPMLVPVLFERYGSRPDPRRLDWWALAHQLHRPPADG
jgi:aminoglycoside phosphotransferase